MKRTRLSASLLVVLAGASAAVACGGKNAQAPSQEVLARDVTTRLLAATREEATGDPLKARDAYLGLLDANGGSSPWELVGDLAAVDALVLRDVESLAEVAPDTALAFRLQDPEPVRARLESVFKRAGGPFKKGIVARALERLAIHRGAAGEAERWRVARGCVQSATVLAATRWDGLSGVRETGLLEAWDAPLPATFPSYGPFARKEAPVAYAGRGCSINLSAVSTAPGVREVVVDVDVPERQRIGVALRARGAAVVRVGGRTVIDRPYELGSGPAARFATVEVDRGSVRLVVRAAHDEGGGGLELDVFDADGNPLPSHAPKPGSKATVHATASDAVRYPEARTMQERTVVALAALAAADGRSAEHLLHEDQKSPKASPELLLAYARAVGTARDLSGLHRAERARAAYERILEAWPGSWEAVLAHAVLAGVRRAQGEARTEALKDLEAHRQPVAGRAGAVLDVFDAVTSARDRLYDRARSMLVRATPVLLGSSLLHEAQRNAVERALDDQVRFACSPAPPNDRGGFACYDALHAAGDRPASGRELERLRALHGGRQLFLAVVLRDAHAGGDVAAVRAAYAAMLPGERTLSALSATAPADALAQLTAAALTARDAPAAIGPLLRAAGEDPAAPFAGVAEKVTAADRAKPAMASAATVILAHSERYEVDPRGLVRYVLFDVRRVSGTTDVEENAQADAPDLLGRATMRILRRRIFKKDGRVLEPDRTPNASQSHADLSQLEQGDAVEALYEGWAVPGETGDVGIDTPDLLPDRTAIVNAEVELRLPRDLKHALWSHALLGKATESADGSVRVLRWKLADRGVRRIEDAMPKMDRNVGVSLSTARWADVGRALREQLIALDEHNPEIAAFAREAARGVPSAKPTTRELVEAVVTAVGAAVREASPGVLSDIGVGSGRGGQTMTARTILADHEGSRSWLIVRSLRELGIAADVVIAENEPFSADPAFPPHFGRFAHPLVVARLPAGEVGKSGAAPGANPASQEIWIDADVPGPPLPAGRISPELRGRLALHTDGTITPITAGLGEGERDEIDIRLVLDEEGNAKGSFTALLRGRGAQELSEALLRMVGIDRQRALRNVVLGWIPYANVEEVALSSSEGSWQVAIRADVTAGGYAQVEGTKNKTQWVLPGLDPIHVGFPRAAVSTLGSTYAGQGARETALAINRAVQYHAHRRVQLPAGATVVRTPGPFRVSGPNLEASRAIKVSGAEIEDDFVVGIATGTIPPDRYGAFVSDAHHTDDAFLASARVTPPSKK